MIGLTAALAGLLPATPCLAQDVQGDFHGEAGISYYANDDDLEVKHPWVQVRQRPIDELMVTAGWTADVISAATVDVVSAATAPFTETRNEGSGSVMLDVADIRTTTAYIYSNEKDTISHTGSLSWELDAFERNLTAGLAYGYTNIHIGAWDEPKEIWDRRYVHQANASLTQVLGPRTVVGGAYTLQMQKGDLSSAYIMVPLFPSSPDTWDRENAQWVDERHPDTRNRHALALNARQALGERVFLRALWRGYLDSWAMRSHAGELGSGFDLGKGVVIEVSDRFHWQSAVSFYRSTYTVNREYLTRDRRLGELIDNIAALSLRPGGRTLEAVIKAELHWTRYADHYIIADSGLEPTPDTWAGVGQVAFGVDL